MVFNKEKLLDVYDETKDNPKDPVRTGRGRLGPASEFKRVADAEARRRRVVRDDRAAKAASPGVIGAAAGGRRRMTTDRIRMTSSAVRLVIGIWSFSCSRFGLRTRFAMSSLWGAKSGASGLTFWEHVLELGNGKLDGDFIARADGVRRVVVDAAHGAAAENHRADCWRSAGADWLASQLNASGGRRRRRILFARLRRRRFCAAILMITNRNPVYSALWFALVTLERLRIVLAAVGAVSGGGHGDRVCRGDRGDVCVRHHAGPAKRGDGLRPALAAAVFGDGVRRFCCWARCWRRSKSASAGRSAFRGRAAAGRGGQRAEPSGEGSSELDTMLGLGRSLFGDYLFAVELAGTLLLVATIGAIAIAPRRRRGTL